MNSTEVFQILGIEATGDEKVIKTAYRERLSETNPEDDPEGFMRLRQAYEEACRLAKNPDASDRENAPEPVRDTTPSGLWLERVKAVYSNMELRRDVKSWKELFDDDCFQSLEEEENCRLKLLRFLMEHFRLPADVWKLLDRRLNIVKDAAGLQEHFPADFVRYMINKCERGEDVDFSQFEGPQDGPYDQFLLYYDRCWQAIQEKDFALAQENIRNADQLNIRHPVLEICRAKLLLEQGKPGEASALMEALRDQYPGDAMVDYNAAEIFWQLKERDRAADIYRTLKEGADSHYMANLRLTEWYYEKGKYHEAKQCAEKVLASGGDAAFMTLLSKVNAEIEKELEAEYRQSGSWEPGLELCWCYLQDGRTSKGIRLAKKLKTLLPAERDAEYKGLMAKLLAEGAEYAESAAMTKEWEISLEEKLADEADEEEREKDRDRLRQARLIRMQCYRNLGFLSRENFSLAVSEGESVLTNTIKDAGVLLELAQICMEMQEYRRCNEIVEKLADEYQIYAAYAVLLEACRRQLDAAGVIRTGRLCLRYFPGFVNAYEYMAKVYLDLKYTEEFRKLLEEAEVNGVKSVILDAYRYQLDHAGTLPDPDPAILNAWVKKFRTEYLARVEKGQLFFYESGLEKLTGYLYQYPDSYMLVERAVFHRAAHHFEEAKEDYEKALASNPANPYALNGLSLVYRYTGDYEKALVFVKRAILYMGDKLSPVVYMDMAAIYSLLSDYEGALTACRKFAEAGGEQNLGYLVRLSEFYVNLGKIEEACRVYERLAPQAKSAGDAADAASLSAAGRKYRYEIFRWQTDACVRGGSWQKAMEVLAQWKAQLDRDRGVGFKRLRPDQAMQGYYCTYYNMLGWAQLIGGERKAALAAFKKSLGYLKDTDGAAAGRLADAVFACVVCEDTKQGLAWGKRLKDCMAKETQNAEDCYYEREKMKLQQKLLYSYFTEKEENLQKLLDQEKECLICRHCASPICKELEGVRVMLLIKIGQKQAALDRLRKNLEIQPADEYMLAVRHTVFADEP